MQEKVLVTGGAGFIGRFVAEELLRRGHQVRVLDSLIEQVHGDCERPAGLPDDVELVRADIRNGDAVTRALHGIDSVIHLAAEVGVGQSMYAVERYTSVNDVGTAVLFEKLIEQPVRRVVTASSMSIYGEGLYRAADGALVEKAERGATASGKGGWDPLDAQGRALTPVATPEWKRPSLASIYALNKFVQERTTLILSQPYGIEGVCLRLFNVYGPGQALSNPYTGVLAIFASRLLNGQAPMIFEDGEQRRDFVYVGDVARAFADALELPGISGEVFNIGSGHDRSVTEVATELARAMGKDIAPEIVGKARIGDIRHCFCDTSKAAERLRFRARQDFGEGLAELAEWVAEQTAVDRVDEARAELEARGLVA
ncbi:NAD-dependent epimerase/dehydratase family protein [Sphingomonas sp. MAH-20]|uniref:NAD-dependent epimerase/dehydratase family protein n=2 Tax=Sphingomonas TaxID=13687 RepID=A0A6I4J4I2_9SPHN|nr:NAD-dependent epimerase/dehydratase family protein [Sphingomonas horti]MBA2918990.1 NAD-dependent epimerase/dehydratase family protein [Sphingomonas sp. CGMCC 1.13658]MVO79023.1 NAD-dependent epimerase/dehydratase family protein [Sphingomonas horti]